MTKNDDFFRRKKPAAVLKHSILREYLKVYVGMVGSVTPGPIWLVDGYAGPGTYAATPGSPGTVGSPVVALEVAREMRRNRDLRCAFIEAHSEHAATLRRCVQPFVDDGMTARVLEGDVGARLPEIWAQIGSAPVLTFLDPFGVDTVPYSFATGELLASTRRFSEVMVNINVEAVGRLGGWLERRDSEVAPRHGCELGVERVDRFMGGTWWRADFFDARGADETTAAEAADRVVKTYCRQVEATTGCSSLSVPIRRRPGRAPIFQLTLFYRHKYAGYKFADAARRASRRWRDTFRAEELADALDTDDALFDLSAEIRRWSAEEAERQERDLTEEWAHLIEENIVRLLDRQATLDVARDIVAILGSTLSLAGEPELRRAWDGLAAKGVVLPRDKKQKALNRLTIDATR